MLGLLGHAVRFDKEVIEDTKLIIDVAEKLGLDSVYCTIGCHPHDYRDFSDEAEKRLRADSWLEVLYVPRCRVAQTCVFQCNVASGNPSVWPKSGGGGRVRTGLLEELRRASHQHSVPVLSSPSQHVPVSVWVRLPARVEV